MAVYTKITSEELSAFLAEYDLGTLVRFEGIQQGVSNTNYHVFTSKGRYVLTIFEEHRTRRADLPFLFGYAGHLAGNGVPCPQALFDKDGDAIKDLHGKPAAIISYLEGKDLPRGGAEAGHCRQMGAFTAAMHEAAHDFPLSRESDWGVRTWRPRVEAMDVAQLDDFSTGLSQFLFDELDYFDAHYPSSLPEAVVHVDLFPDNIFFKNGKISAMIDMYFACTEALAYDLAIVVNAWCFSAGEFLPEHFKALMEGYESVRPLEAVERDSFQTIMCAASMRFLVSRLDEWFSYDPEKADMKPHDPMEYLERLKFHQSRDVLEL